MPDPFIESIREALKSGWRDHPPIERVVAHGAILDGDVLVGHGAGKVGLDLDTTFFSDQVIVNTLVTGFQAKGATVVFETRGHIIVVAGDHRLDKPLLLLRGTTMRVVVRDADPSSTVSLVMRGYELRPEMVDDVKMVVAELYAS